MNSLGNILKPICCSIIFLLGGTGHFILGQQLDSELNTKLSTSDQKKIQKASELFAKGSKIETEAQGINKDDRKYQLKRLESADYFQRANEAKKGVYDDNISAFWKKHKGEKHLPADVKKIETAAADSFKKAQSFRKSADKERKLPDRIRFFSQAEKTEARALLMLQKILYSYLNWPVNYDYAWISSDNLQLPHSENEQITVEKEPVKLVKTAKADTVRKAKTTATQDTATTAKFTKKANEEVVGNDSSLYGKIKIKEEQVDQFNEFLKKKYPAQYENYVINFSSLDYSNIEALREEWYKYQFGYAQSGDSLKMAASNTDSLTGNTRDKFGATQVALNQNTRKGGTKNKGEGVATAGVGKTGAKTSTLRKANVSDDVASEPYVAENRAGKTGKVGRKPGTGLKSGITGTSRSSRGFTYKVQIAACRVPLDEATLQGIYNGPEDIVELTEENWNKYVIGEFTTYKAASRLRDKTKIPGAFVIAYLNGRRIMITPAMAYRKSLGYNKTEGLTPALIRYRIQIGASKIPVSEGYLKNMYSGPIAIDVMKEEGWYKYSLLAGKTFQEAQNLLNQVSIPGAFIVAYHKNMKVEIHTAIKLTK
jgi:hypothetical protein